MQNSITLDRLTFGVCYYPEHWPEHLWRSDLERMRAAGITVIRIAEFAWNAFEPREGEFTFAFFDHFLHLLSEFPEIKAIFCTPTATPPAWLTERYPEVLNVSFEGVPYTHGKRRHYNYNAHAYQKKARAIAARLGEHYACHPSIIGWQIDNELNCETDVFYSEADHDAFREYLKARYSTLDALNEAWGTVVWNQAYTDWPQVHLSRFAGGRAGVNPHLSLDEKRFFSASAIAFCRMQYEALREYVPADRFITTNGTFGHLDYGAAVGHAIDFLCYDSYPNFGAGMADGPGDSLGDRRWSWNLANVRAFSPLFGVMEQQSGANGWVARMASRAPLPGQIRLWAFQSIAHGADFVSFFRWRTATFGTEIYWHGILDYDNRDNRKLAEVARTIQDAGRVGTALAGMPVWAGVAVLRDYDNQWDGEDDIWHGPLRRASEAGWFEALQTTHTPYDIVYVDDCLTPEKLSRYGLAVYPHASILTPERAALLQAYVAGGGRLVLGARTGYKDLRGHCPMTPAPGPAAGLCGATVAEGSMLVAGEAPVQADWDGERLDAVLWNDVLEPVSPDARVLARYSDGRFQEAPALIEHPTGTGATYFFGAAFSADASRTFLRKLGFSSPMSGRLELPAGCELAVRAGGDQMYHIVLNYGQDTTIILKTLFTDRLTGERLIGETRMERFGVRILTPGIAEVAT